MPAMSLSVAVVIPTYNRAGPLARALASVGRQSLRPAEVVVVDDGSDDGTCEMVAQRFPEARLVRQLHAGVSAARNRGIGAAESEWLAFLDSDDEWLPDKLAIQMRALARASDRRLCHCDEIWVRNGVRVNPGVRHAKSGGWIFRRCLPRCAISPSAAIVHHSVFDDVGLFDERLPACEDYDFWLRFTASNPVVFVDERLVIKNGGHADQLSRSVEALDRYRIRSLVNLLERSRLDEQDRRAAVVTLLRKIDIYRAGAIKRGRRAEVKALERTVARFAPEVSRAVGS